VSDTDEVSLLEWLAEIRRRDTVIATEIFDEL
jgi:hypothetical protein